jgi:predicted double-glycine peptidase
MTRLSCIILTTSLMLALAQQTAVAGGLALSSYGVRMHAQVRSIKDIRNARVVKQKWDQSCGSAALSTLLTYYLDIPTAETAIIGDMVRHGDPLRVRQRGGFSLLDLKRYVQRQGYKSQGFGRMSLDELADYNTPAIVPIKTHGYDHFVIFIARFGDRVVLADPAYGNLTLGTARFEAIWQNGIAFMVFTGAVGPAPQRPAPDLRLPVALLSPLERDLRGMGPVPPVRVGR